MNTFKLFRTLVAIVGTGAAIGSAPAAAEDIDIFKASGGAGNTPNVLFVMDNTSNWNASLRSVCYYKEDGVVQDGKQGRPGPFPADGGSLAKKFDLERCALYNVLDGMPVNADGSALFNVGFMFFNENNPGGYVRKAFTPVSTANKVTFKTFLKSLESNTDSAGAFGAAALSMYEAQRYFTGAAPYAGQLGNRYDAAAFSGGRYAPPGAIDSGSCVNGYIIFVANGVPDDKAGNDGLAQLAALGGDTRRITPQPAYDFSPYDGANWTDEYARFLAATDVSSATGVQSVKTFAVAVTGASSDKAFYPKFMDSIGINGGTGPAAIASDAGALELKLNSIFAQLQGVNSGFASASLPAAVNAQGSFLNQLYMGQFRPDANGKPRWRGNLKQYQFKYDAVADSLSLADADGVPAVSAVSGFFLPTARSFWSTTSSYWVNQPIGASTTPKSDSPDGEIVEKGGAAQRLRTVYATSQTSRNVYTCLSCSNGTTLTTASTQFSTTQTTSSLSPAMLGVTTQSERDALINWARGADNAGDEQGPRDGSTVRPTIHGDVLHSRPLVVNYGGTRGIVVFYGTNAGFLHAVNGNQTSTTSPNAGDELWSFIPEEFLGKLKRLRDNTPSVRISTTPASLNATPKDYMVDGPIGLYQKYKADGSIDKVYIYLAMRRGGRFIYALDVTTPDAPKFLWKRGTSDSGLSTLGQTWSEPKVAKVKGKSNPVIIMGGGYDAAAEDVTPVGSTTMGNSVVVLDALTGSHIKSFATDRSVPSDVALIDFDADGYIDRAYASDVGGNVYRIDLETATSTSDSAWTIYKIASLANGGTRKFFYPPDVVLTRSFAAILIGSGDREKPLRTTSTDAFFTVYDKRLSKGAPSPIPTALTQSSLGESGTSATFSDGCYIPMASGEKIVTSAVTVAGISYFSSNQPVTSTAACTANLGKARTYGAPLFCQTPEVSVLSGGGLPPSPVAGVVQVSYTPANSSTPAFKFVPFVIGGINVNRSAIEVMRPVVPLSPKRRLRYWYLEDSK